MNRRQVLTTSALLLGTVGTASALTTAQKIVVLKKRLDPATVALIAAMTIAPTSARVQLINQTIVALKAQGLWQQLGLFYMLAAENAQAAGLNWVSPTTAALIPTNSPTFATDRGYTGDGSTSYLETGVADNAVPQLSQNSAHAGAWNLTASNNFTVGVATGVSTALASTTIRNVRLNGATPLATTGDPTTGHVVAVRRDALNLFSYRNGGTEVTGANASGSLVASTVRILVGNSLFYSGQVACAHLGNQLSAGQVATLYAILQNYLHQVGAV